MTDYLRNHLKILKLAAQEKLPERIDKNSELPINIIRELVDADYLKAIDTSSLDGPEFLKPSITTAGREHLITLEKRKREKSIPRKAFRLIPISLRWIFGILAAVIAGLLIWCFTE